MSAKKSSDDNLITGIEVNAKASTAANILNGIYNYPPSEAQYPGWLNNFTDNCHVFSTKYDISDTILAELDVDRNALNYMETVISKMKVVVTGNITNRNALVNGAPDNPALTEVDYIEVPKLPNPPTVKAKPNMRERHKRVVMMLRNDPRMEKPDAQKLGILTATKPKPNPEDFVPKLKAKIKPDGTIELQVALLNFFGYKVYRASEADLNPTIIGTSPTSIFIDNIPGAKGLRSYYIQMIDANSNPVGQYSNTVRLGVK